ncbi:LexA family protein [Notoacmeibacter ruber]|uniref:Peptidase S24 n=1 Tax=Notoacmeibacter ruber TaxID=2670375 RepID=A0A3L7J310_9HYPH|nr:S24 family peptidase [Notoacmeibacter ruber]RLQ85006.1 peptidase S24 [Notoacmeibacter ruber]
MILHFARIAVSPQLLPFATVNVAAGFPSPAADDLEDTIDPIAWIVRHESAIFWWRVSGDSLEAEGIMDGDLIAVDRAGKKRLGRIVLAVVDGAVTLKKLARREGVYFLDPRSHGDRYAPIKVTESTEIWGVVAGVVRRLPVE